MRSVHTRVAHVVTVACIAVLGSAALGIDLAARMYHQEANQRLHLELASWLVSQYHFERDGQVDRAGAAPLFGEAMRVNPTIEIYLIDTTGRILAFNAPAGRVRLASVDLAPIRALLAGTHALPILGTDPRNPAVRQVFSVAPIPTRTGIAGYVYVIVGGEKYRGLLAQLRVSQVTRWLAIGVIAVLAVGLLGGVAAYRFLTRRIAALAADMSAFSANGFTSPPSPTPDPSGPDDLDLLRQHFRQLSELIQDQVKQLRASDRQLREAIAALSHDLQTPLTALGGYLETLHMQEDTLSSPQRRQFLTLASAQKDRLERMIRSQLELSLLESPAYPFDPQEGSICDLVNDVALEFGLAAQTAGVTLTAEAPTEPVTAWMDVSLIQRVLENLISNSLRHTPAGGKVNLAVIRTADRVHVSIRDTGCGIHPDELPKIFERPFRGSATARRSGSGAGLGLTIVRRIVELHGGRVTAKNLQPAGAQFTFDLPVGPHSTQPTSIT
jgi:two-component system, OmpR family, sensor kinase